MSLQIDCRLIPDPSGFNKALLLKGDWLVVTISDGKYTGMGEASHSGDDRLCIKKIHELFERYVKDINLIVENIKELEQETFSSAPDFLTATAISGINQALYELIAWENDIPVWKLFTSKPAREKLELYVTINRALTTRTINDYLGITSLTLKRGFNKVKCAPFEKVTPGPDQLENSRQGLSILRRLRSQFPDIDLSIDFHKRFSPQNFSRIFEDINKLSPYWIEEPCKIGPHYRDIRERTSSLLAAGELFYGSNKFLEIMSNNWADVIMPDVKHVGGFGPLLKVCNCASRFNVMVSPHNPSGPVSTMASLHSAAVSPSVKLLEIPLLLDDTKMLYKKYIQNGYLHLPDKPGWGIQI